MRDEGKDKAGRRYDGKFQPLAPDQGKLLRIKKASLDSGKW